MADPTLNAPIPGFGPSLLAAANVQSGLNALPTPSIAMPNFGGGAPAISAPSLRPVSPPIPGTVQGDQLERQRLLSTGSGISHIHNPFLHGAAATGDTILSLIAPHLDQTIPGTNLHHNLLVNQAQQNLANDQANQFKMAQIGQQNALAKQEEAKADALSDPTKAVDPSKTVTTDDGVYQLNPATGHYDTRVGDQVTKPVPPHYTNMPDGSVVAITTDKSGVPTAKVVYKGDPKVESQIVPLQIGGVEHSVVVNKQDGTPIKDLGPTGNKPPVVNVNAGLGALDRETKQFGTPYQKSLDASNAQLEKIADARAMINGNAESQGLGVPKVLTALVGGQGTGVRITQAELTAIAHARGLSGDIEGTLNKWAGQGALTKTQQQQLTQIMDDVKGRLLQKQAIASQALDSVNGASSREQIIQADKDARQKLSSLETGGSAGGGEQIPAAAAAQLQEGVVHTFGNGQQWTKHNGQPVRVK